MLWFRMTGDSREDACAYMLFAISVDGTKVSAPGFGLDVSEFAWLKEDGGHILERQIMENHRSRLKSSPRFRL